MSDPPAIHEPDNDAGPSSLPASRSNSPSGHSDTARTLRRPASHGRLARLMTPGRSRSSSSASQQETPHTAYAADGVHSSGRTTPEQRRRSSKAAASSLLANDARYKKYAAQVDKCLQAFESVNEWADFISFLSRLLKTLQMPSPPYAEVPRKLLVAKRLAQCLNPALPSGVHQRALDVYAQIFTTIGVDGLRRDLLIWSLGIFPFFQFAATSVRPILINIYESYYLPLGAGLRPAIKAFILALLPGMDEETGDFFDKVLSLLNRVSHSFSPAFFLQNVYLILISSPSSRLAAINYLSRQNQITSDPDTKVDVGLVLKGIAAVLADTNSLVRRGGLDLLLKILPLNGGLMKEAEETDRKLLLRAAVGVVLQRELSLSRRVYSWLLGPEETSEQQMAYFKAHGLDLLASTLEADIWEATSDASASLTSTKVFLSLLDRWEVGSILSERLTLPALRTIKIAAERPGTSHDELIMTASALYDAAEPIIVWRAFFTSLQDGQEDSLMRWLLQTIPQKDEEVTTLHLPLILDFSLGTIKEQQATNAADPLAAAALCQIILGHIPSSVFVHSEASQSDAPALTAASFYADSSSRPEDAIAMVSSHIIPRIVSQIFDITPFITTQSDDILLLLVEMASHIIDIEANALAHIDIKKWVSTLIEQLPKTPNFVTVDTLVTTALKVSQATVLKAKIAITTEPAMSIIFDSLFRHLEPGSSAYHVRVVELIWECNQIAEIHTLENVISRHLSSSSPKERSKAVGAFGVLWRLTEDAMLPGEIFYTPILTMIDALESKDPEIQRTATSWMECNLRSPFRVLDPIMVRLLDLTSHNGDVSARSVVDLSSVDYLIRTISTLWTFGREDLSRGCLATGVSKSTHPILASKAQDVYPGADTYLDLLLAVLLSQLQAAIARTGRSKRSLLLRVHDSTISLLQIIIDQKTISQNSLNSLNSILLDQLSQTTKEGQCMLQGGLLRLLYSALNCAPTLANKAHKRSISSSEKSGSTTDPDIDSLLVPIVTEGISSTSKRPALQHWIDFVLMYAPSLRSRPNLLQQISGCVSFNLTKSILDLRSLYEQSSSPEQTGISESEPMLLLSALELLLNNLSGSAVSNRKSLEGKISSEAGSGFLGLMSGVFIAESSDEKSKQANESPSHLAKAIEALLVTWTITSQSSSQLPRAARLTRSQTYSRVRSKAKQVLEQIFRSSSSAIMRSCVAAWAIRSAYINDMAIFNCIDTLSPSAQKVVELITNDLRTSTDRTTDPQQLDPATMAFLEAYISRLEAPIAVQIWNTTFAFSRDMLAAAGTTTAKSQLYPLLRCLTALCRTVTTTSALEDRRLRRELQDVYPKVLDAVVMNIPRGADIPTWSRGSDSSDLANGHQNVNQTLHVFLSDEVLPTLRAFLVEPDRVASACYSISTSIASPALRQHRAVLAVLGIVLEMTKLPSSTKSWRPLVGDFFNDSRFFRIKPEEITLWKSLICALMDSDKERFPELLSRITAAPSANIFTNAEQEMLTRSANLRRLSFVLLAAEENHYLTQLPAIQEKLVDILRTNVVSPKVHSEVYLTLRVLMCRISPQHLTNFWPVILAELLRVFEELMDDIPPDGSESLQLALAACKFLDLLLVIQSEDFQIHQWMFVTDTTDAAYPGDEFTPEAIMDAISEIVSDASVGLKNDGITLSLNDQDITGLRRPRLSQPFFSRASMDTFEGVYANSGVDWQVVEEGLTGEIFTSHD